MVLPKEFQNLKKNSYLLTECEGYLTNISVP